MVLDGLDATRHRARSIHRHSCRLEFTRPLFVTVFQSEIKPKETQYRAAGDAYQGCTLWRQYTPDARRVGGLADGVRVRRLLPERGCQKVDRMVNL